MTEPLDDARGELLEHIAEIIRDEVRITADGIIYNSADVAKIILNRAAPARCDAENAAPRCARCGSSGDVFVMCAGCQSPLVPPPSEAGREALALERSVVAIDDWLNTYAPDLCNEYRVKEAAFRISEHGTLWYIASVQEQNRAALSLDPGTVAVASAQYRCTCGAEPYCAPNVHDASCPLAVTSTNHGSPE